MNIMRRIRRIYEPKNDPSYVRYDTEVDTKTLLDPDINAKDVPNDYTAPRVEPLDLSPLESIMESYNKPDFHVHIRDFHDKEKDKLPDEPDESLLKLGDTGSELDDTLKNDDDFRPNYIPSGVVDYYNESVIQTFGNSNIAKYAYIKKETLGNGQSIMTVNMSKILGQNAPFDVLSSILAEDLLDECIKINPDVLDVARIRATKSAKELIDYFKELVQDKGWILGKYNANDDGYVAGLDLIVLLSSYMYKNSDVADKVYDEILPKGLSESEWKKFVDTRLAKLHTIIQMALAVILVDAELIGIDVAASIQAAAEAGDNTKAFKILKQTLKHNGSFNVIRHGHTWEYDMGPIGRGKVYINDNMIIDPSTNKRIMVSPLNTLARAIAYDYTIFTHGRKANGKWVCDPIWVDGKTYDDVDLLLKDIMKTGNEKVYLCCCNGEDTNRYNHYKNLEYTTRKVIIEAATESNRDIDEFIKFVENEMEMSATVYNALCDRVRVFKNLIGSGDFSAVVYTMDEPKIKLKLAKSTDKANRYADYMSVIRNVIGRYRAILYGTRDMLRRMNGSTANGSYYWTVVPWINKHPTNTEGFANEASYRYGTLRSTMEDALRFALVEAGDVALTAPMNISLFEDVANGYNRIGTYNFNSLLEDYADRFIDSDHNYYFSGTIIDRNLVPSAVNEYYNGSLNEAAMKAKQRNALDDSEFGLPRLRAYPLNDAKHVKAAIRMFNHCKDPEDQKTLAHNIFRAMKKFNVDMKIGEANALYKYAPKELQEEAYPHFLIQAVGKPMKERTKEDIIKEHLRTNSDFYNNAFYGTEYANAIKELDGMEFMDVFYPNLRSMSFDNRLRTVLGGTRRGDTNTYDPKKNWFRVNLSKDENHTEYCNKLYDIMQKMLLDDTWDPRTLTPEEMGVLLDWYQRVSYHYGCLKDTDDENEKRREIQYLWDLFWNFNENPDDQHIKSINVIAFISQMKAIDAKGKALAMNEDQIIGRQDLCSYLEKELGDDKSIYLLPDTKEFPIIDQLSVHLAMDKIGAVPKEKRKEFSHNLNRRYRELGCDFSITCDHPYAKYASKNIVDRMTHVLMEDSSLPIDDQSHADEDKAQRAATPYYKRSDFECGSNWHNILDNKEMGPNNLKTQRPDYTAGESLL